VRTSWGAALRPRGIGQFLGAFLLSPALRGRRGIAPLRKLNHTRVSDYFALPVYLLFGNLRRLSALAWSRTSSSDRARNLATSASATPRFKASIRKIRSALFHAAVAFEVFTVCSNSHLALGVPRTLINSGSGSTLQRNERVKLAATFWNNVGAGMVIGGMAGAFFLDKPPGAWIKIGVAIAGLVLGWLCYSIASNILTYLHTLPEERR
jgi:hypothetical protein